MITCKMKRQGNDKTMKSNQKRHPGIGLRMIKSAVAVGLCFLVYVLRGYKGIPFYTALAALQCMQPYRENTKGMAIQRTSGTFIGAFFGLLTIIVQYQLLIPHRIGTVWYYALVSGCVIAVLYTAVMVHQKNAAYFSCVVYLCITMVHIGDENPYLFVFNRVLDTLIGIVIGMLVNSAQLPRRKRRDVLFVAGFDDVLITKGETQVSDYSRVELNRMLDEGLPFTIMTMRTPASYLESAKDIRIKLPLILMDGAVLYDAENNTFLEKCELEYEDAKRLVDSLKAVGLDSFQNVIAGDSVIIYFEAIGNEGAGKIYEKLKKSPYRNYLCRALPEGERVAYIMSVDKKDKIMQAYRMLEKQGDTKRYKVLCYDSDDYEGYAYLKIYNQNASKLKMLEKLKEYTGFSSTRSFGSIPGMYDVVVEHATGDKVIKLLKQEFEPVIWKKITSRSSCPTNQS